MDKTFVINPPSEGELFIADYFRNNDFRFEKEYVIKGLKHDSAAYRRADFYLPGYKVYVEFEGKYNDPEERMRYREKKNVYKRNDLPVIYIYPDNLGFIDYIFRMRLIKLLRDRNMKWQLFKYWSRQFIYRIVIAVSFVLGGLLIASSTVMTKEEQYELLEYIGFGISILGLWLIVEVIVKAIRRSHI